MSISVSTNQPHRRAEYRLALDLADGAYALQHGQVIPERTALKLAVDESIERAYLGESEIA
jgi:ABC-type branched-subunit amino acid transport system ATPase component